MTKSLNPVSYISHGKMNVLMLGWEFPPLINGGLGVACLGLARAMSKRVDLQFILPRIDPHIFSDELKLIGINTLEDIQELQSEHRQKRGEIERLGAINWISETPGKALKPYGHDERESASSPTLTQDTRCREHQMDSLPSEGYLTQLLSLFQDEELYGENIGERVWAYAQIAARLAEQMDFDVVHAHDWMTFLAGIEIKKRTGKPLVVHVHSLNYDRAGAESKGWIYDIEKSAMEQADLVIPVSQYTGKICHEHYGIATAKIRFVHNGAEPVKAFHSISPFKSGLVLFLGRLTGQKGPQFFLEIAAEVLKKIPNARFVMAGTGEQMKSLIEYGAYREVGDRLHFTGFLNKEKVNKLLSMTDVYCMPSVSEPFGLSALEAAQYGIPAVISKQSGVAEVLTHARKADYWDVELMAQHIIDLLTDENARQEAIAHSLKDQQNCTWEAASDRIVEHYENYLHIT